MCICQGGLLAGQELATLGVGERGALLSPHGLGALQDPGRGCVRKQGSGDPKLDISQILGTTGVEIFGGDIE